MYIFFLSNPCAAAQLGSPPPLHCVHSYTKSKTSAFSRPRGQKLGLSSLFLACTCFFSQTPEEVLLHRAASPGCFVLNPSLASALTSPAHPSNIRTCRAKSSTSSHQLNHLSLKKELLCVTQNH